MCWHKWSKWIMGETRAGNRVQVRFCIKCWKIKISPSELGIYVEMGESKRIIEEIRSEQTNTLTD